MSSVFEFCISLLFCISIISCRGLLGAKVLQLRTLYFFFSHASSSTLYPACSCSIAAVLALHRGKWVIKRPDLYSCLFGLRWDLKQPRTETLMPANLIPFNKLISKARLVTAYFIFVLCYFSDKLHIQSVMVIHKSLTKKKAISC